MQGRALAVGSLLLAAAVAGSSDATASKPGIVIVAGPRVQTLETKIVSRLDAKTHRLMPALRFGTARFTVTVKNPGADDLAGVAVVDPQSPGCNRRIGMLAAGASLTYACRVANVARNFTTRLTATAFPLRSLAGAANAARTTAKTTASVRLRPPRRRSHVPPPVFQGRVSRAPTLPFTG
jgi:hypothetical protein